MLHCTVVLLVDWVSFGGRRYRAPYDPIFQTKITSDFRVLTWTINLGLSPFDHYSSLDICFNYWWQYWPILLWWKWWKDTWSGSWPAMAAIRWKPMRTTLIIVSWFILKRNHTGADVNVKDLICRKRNLWCRSLSLMSRVNIRKWISEWKNRTAVSASINTRTPSVPGVV